MFFVVIPIEHLLSIGIDEFSLSVFHRILVCILIPRVCFKILAKLGIWNLHELNRNLELLNWSCGCWC